MAGSTARSGAPHRATAVVFAVVFLVAVGAGDATTYDTKGSAYSAAPRARSESAAANLWVGLGGRSACARSATPVKYVAAVAGGNVCDSGPTAYSRAQLGDTVLIEGGTYTSQWNFTPAISKAGTAGTCNYNYPGTPNLSSCITFKPAPGQSVTFQVGGSNVPQIRVCASFVSIQNVTIAMTTYVSGGVTLSNSAVDVGSGDRTCLPGGSPPHDLYFSNNNYGGQAEATGGASHVWYVGGVAAGTVDFPWQMGGQACLQYSGPNCVSASPNANNNGIVRMTFQGYNFANTDPGHHHMECIHDTPGSDHITLAASRLLGCPVESFYAEGSSQTNLLIENNYFDGGSSMEFGCDSNGCVMSNITIRFNSFHGAGFFPENVCKGPGPCATIDNNVSYGNIGDGCPTWSVPKGGSYTGSGFTTAYNVEAVARGGICTGDSTSKFLTVPAYVSPGPPAYDLRLRPGAPALRAGNPSSHPPRDIQGLLRPLRVAPDAGAAQRETAELVVGKSIGAVSLGMSAGDVAAAYGLKRPKPGTRRHSVHHRIDGRNVWLRYAGRVVVGIETTSPYYTTLSGLGAGSSASDALAGGFKWSAICRRAYLRRQGQSVTYLIPSGGIPTRRISAVAILRRSQELCPRRGARR